MFRSTALSALAMLVFVGAFAPSSAGAAGTKRCASVRDIGPTGRDPADAISVRVTGVSCTTARSVIRSWSRRIVGQGDRPVHTRGFTCRESISQTAGRISERCTASGGRVLRFKLG